MWALTSCSKETLEPAANQHTTFEKNTRNLSINAPGDSTQTFKVLSYNIYEGFRADAARIASFKQWVDTLQPAVIAFQEMKGFTYAQLQSFAGSMGYNYTLMHHQNGLPVALISKFPITDIKSKPSTLHLVQAKVLDYHFFVIHLNPNTYMKRKEEIDTILNRAAKIPATEKVLMMGDFNNMSPQDSSFYDNNVVKMNLLRASEANNPGTKVLNNDKIDYTTIQAMLTAGYHDSWKINRSNYDKSAPTKLRTHGNFTRIDYIWMNTPLLGSYVNSYLVKDVFTDYASDHYPMVLILNR
ncbi:hypothetical protein AB669_13220 [Pedobacter sp. BMA]|nr:hypothetical protein AB669_13220 [Pedobacter sp. BMA]